MADFYIGYLTSAILALFFLGLGALIMYGSGEDFSNSGVKFSSQLVSLYSASLGDWSKSLIAGIAFITIFSTALTVIDGYPRSIEAALVEIFDSAKKYVGKIYWICAIVLSIFAAIIINSFLDKMTIFIDIATISSFLAAPVFAFINYRLVTCDIMPEGFRPGKWLKVLSVLGIIFLTGFGILFIYARIAL